MSKPGFRARLLDLPRRSWTRAERWLSHPQLGRWLALCAVVLSSSALWLGFYQDDFIGRYVYSDLEGAARLYRNYSAGYGLAIGDPAENHWQMEAGWAPWWHYEYLRFSLYRPLGVLFHTLDFTLWPDNATLMHAQNLLWLAGLVAAITWMYRGILGLTVGGAAALLFAFDETHGYAVGHICNRHALIGALLGALCLGAHVRQRATGSRPLLWLGPLFYVLGLLSSESVVSVVAYVVAYALLVERGSVRARALSVAPYFVITVVWRALYTRAGYGAEGSGVYIDLAREPLSFVRAFLERGPILWLGQFLTPPADIYSLLPEGLARGMLAWALVVLAVSIWALFPLLRRDRVARFWALGLVGSLVPAGATAPHNRLLIFASFGALGLLAQLWQLYATDLQGALIGRLRWGKWFGISLLAYRLVASPLGLPLATAHIALSAPMHTAAAAIGDEVAGRDVIFVTAPGFNIIRLFQLMRRIDGAPLPARIRTISNEPKSIRVTRSAPDALEVHFSDGLLSPPSDELHRDRRLSMPAGTEVHLTGFHVDVLEATSDGRAQRVRFTFDQPLESPQLLFLRWDGERFVHFTPPALGETVTLSGVVGSIGLE